MRVYTRQSQNTSKDQKPFIEPSNKAADNGHSFFGKSIQRKESEGGVKKDDEKKDAMQQQNKDLEKDKAQKKEAKEPKEEEQKVQKKEDKKEEEKQVQKKEDKKEEEQKVQKKGDTKEEEKQVQKKDDKDKKDEEKLKTKKISLKEKNGVRKKDKENSDKAASSDLEAKLAANKGKGFTLPNDLNQELSSKMNADFSSVKIHTDAESAAMADELGALAFTYGNDIYFASGQYNPQTPAGKKLLVHELTHVIQQK